MPFLAGLRKQAIVAIAVALWIPAVTLGISILWNYSATPGHAGAPQNVWPRNAPIERGKGRPTLVMFVHPQCQCSRASVGELAILMAHAQGKLDAAVFFYLPPDEPGSWARSDLWASASGIPGVHTFEDRQAAAAKTFGAFTSGQTLLYDSGGRLLFKGGVTSSRGHSGDNAGRSAITALLDHKIPTETTLPVTTPVFGCSLRGE